MILIIILIVKVSVLNDSFWILCQTLDLRVLVCFFLWSFRNKRISKSFVSLGVQDVEKELEIQISMRQEMELAMKMLEKDVCEKQDALVSLRQQLDDLRALKHELAFKLQVQEV